MKQNHGLAGLFGDPHRATVLIAVAKGPIHLRALSRSVSLGYRSTWNIVDDLISEGVLEENLRSSRSAKRFIRLSQTFAARVPLIAVLRMITPLVHLEPSGSNFKLPRRWLQRVGTARVRALFGSPERTQALIYVAIAGKTDSPEMQNALRQSQQGLTKSIRLFETMGLIKRIREGRRTLIQFDRTSNLALDVQAMCVIIASEFPRLAARAKALTPKTLPRLANTRYAATIKRLPFIRASHVRIIAALLSAPKPTSEIASLIGVRILSARDSLKHLASLGIVTLERDSKYHLVASLSPNDDLSNALVSLIAKLSGSRWASSEKTRPQPGSHSKSISIELFHIRYLSVLIDASKQQKTLGLKQSVVKAIANRLHRAGLVELGADGLPIGLSKAFMAYSEVRLLCTSIKVVGEYSLL